ncbi:hypothetical protein VULLAG_LOCUS13237 [Vulpes lagopus]
MRDPLYLGRAGGRRDLRGHPAGRSARRWAGPLASHSGRADRDARGPSQHTGFGRGCWGSPAGIRTSVYKPRNTSGTGSPCCSSPHAPRMEAQKRCRQLQRRLKQRGALKRIINIGVFGNEMNI